MPETWKLEHPDQIGLGDGVRSVRLVAIAGRVNLIGKDGPATLEVTKVSGPPLRVGLRAARSRRTISHREAPKPEGGADARRSSHQHAPS